MATTFILSDESVNSYGFRVFTNGIDTSSFEKNPVALAMHERGVMQVVGRWVNIRKEGKQLLADIEFDEADEFALAVKGKVDRGFVKAASIGINIIEISQEKDLLSEGQYRPTVTRSLISEASIVDIGSNRNALKLNFPSKGVQLSGGFDEKLLELSLPRIQEIGNQTDKYKEMESVKLKLGLSKDADENAVLEALNAQLASKTGPSEREVEILMGLGKEKGFINEENESTYKNLAKADFDSVLGLINGAKKEGKPADKAEDTGRFSDIIAKLSANMGGNASDRNKWTLGDWMDKDEAGLLKLKEEKPDQYAALTKAYYGRAV